MSVPSDTTPSNDASDSQETAKVEQFIWGRVTLIQQALDRVDAIAAQKEPDRVITASKELEDVVDEARRMHPFVSMPKREYSRADEALMDLQYRAQLLLIGPTSPSAFNDAERTQMKERGAVLGSGASGRVWRATMKRAGESDKVVALKTSHTCKKVANPPLRHEACALLALQGHSSIPEVYAWGRSNQFEYLAMQLLGTQNLEERASNGPAFTVEDLATLTCTMLDAVEHVHSRHLIHGDIKPQNFVFSLPPDSRLYLIDYGLTTWHSDPETHVPLEKSRTSNTIGTIVYCSINAHLHQAPSRADDMESLAYTVISLLRGSLPWQKQSRKGVFPNKQLWSGNDLGFGYPQVFGDFVDYTRALGFESEPDYVVVGTSHKDAPDPKPSLQVLPEPESISEFTTPREDDYWPIGTAMYPRVPTRRDLIGDEKATEQEDQEEKEFGWEYLDEIDKFWL
ncbi:kinase-like protein [Stereum hirsutum FP-91666 SS1]|uniref:non-specific serine/threonine protein kinase n=1 Tax=Stereum hirsutum (strain FP-91666) TaxID=721885 RepID=R7RW20_STEHR|nr:kinase-like protein [Stereum hirsutum FP-91666 SS1]EIM79486.1 kinase-like protein [Stereum hirsutum FP-91666 SS1]